MLKVELSFLRILNDGSVETMTSSLGVKYAFIDESGNYGFNFQSEGNSTHFIITAVIVDKNKLPDLEKAVEDLRKKYFQSGEMKSSKVGNNDVRRLKILQDLRSLDFYILSLVVNKKKIKQNTGLAYKKSFIKFFNNILHNELYRAFPNLQILSDEHGRTEFMEEFKNYIIERHQPNLFGSYKFGFINSKSAVLVQLADFICGTIALGFEESKKSHKFGDFLNTLNRQVIHIQEWPESYEKYLINTEVDAGSDFDTTIAVLSLRLANEFIERNQGSDNPDVKEQIQFLKYLQFKLRWNRPDLYVLTKEIIQNISTIRSKRQSVHHLRTRIVAKLRDAGVIIASCSRGYKLPVSEKELYDFTNHTNSVIKPMIDRLKICRDKIKLATTNQLDILDKPEYSNLRKFYDE